MTAARSAHERERELAMLAGRRVRALREARGLSLRDLAGVAAVSVPMLSQVERGESSPTLAVAAKIAAGLGLSLSQLLRLDEGNHVAVVRRGRRHTVRRNGHRYEEVTPPLPGERAAVTIHTLRAGARTGGPGDPPMHAAGSRETAVVQSGSVDLIIDGERTTLGQGDSVTFDADLPHFFENAGPGAATFIAVVTAGLRHTT
jgi:transcriptional regulator with XRE-family HTH domain